MIPGMRFLNQDFYECLMHFIISANNNVKRIRVIIERISKAYGDMIMDSEFCIDKTDRLWFVQARPETRWNEDFELHPDTIFMRRL